MKLVANELRTFELSQTLVATRDCLLVAIRPHLYKHGSVSGTICLKLYDENDQLIKESETISINSISSATYFHGYVRFYIDHYVKNGSTYKVRLESTGYTFSESAYIAWINDLNLSKYDSNFVPQTDLKYPLDMELWARKP